MDGSLLVSSGLEGSVRVWDMATCACLHVREFRLVTVFSMSISSIGLLAMVLHGAGELRVVPLVGDAVIKSVPVATWMSTTAVQFAPPGDSQEFYFIGQHGLSKMSL